MSTVFRDDNLPPVIRILLSDETIIDPTDSLKALRRLIPELRKQATWTIDHFDYEKNAANIHGETFTALPAATANPFTRYGACNAIACRIAAAKTFCRTFGLYV